VQIIVVDDNSDPAVVDFEKFPGLDDPRVEVVFTKEGKGAGYARNVGMERAVGKWLVFADADDYFHPCIADLMDDYRDAEEEIVFFKHDASDGKWRDMEERLEHLNTHIDSYSYSPENGNSLLKFFTGVPWANFVKNHLVKKHQIRFAEVLKYNDSAFACQIGLNAKKIVADARNAYQTLVRHDSLERNIAFEYLQSGFKERKNTWPLCWPQRIPLQSYLEDAMYLHFASRTLYPSLETPPYDDFLSEKPFAGFLYGCDLMEDFFENGGR
jgi:glycosyltransferase involved in cell wall biosynthesis